METRHICYKIPYSDSGLLSEPRLEEVGAILTLRFDYHREDTIYRSGLRFDGIRAYRHRAESHCTKWHVDEVYDTLARIDNSSWVEELREAMPEDMKNLFEMNHYIIYFNSSGCYEIIAKSWEVFPEELGGWG